MTRCLHMLLLALSIIGIASTEAAGQYRWNIEPATSNGFGIGAAMAIGPGGEIIVAHRQYYAPHYKLVVSQFRNGAWETDLVEDDPRDDDIYSVDIAVDDQGNIHLAYSFSLPGNSELKYAFKANGNDTWEISTVVDESVSWPAIVIDAQGNPHIAFSETLFISSYLVHAYRDQSGAWQVEHLEYHSWGTSYPQIAIDSTGRIHIIYLATYLNYYYSVDEEYFWTMTGTWNGSGYDWEKGWIQIFDYYIWPRHISLALDSEDGLHVAMRDPLNHDLIYYHQRHPGIWFEETIESIGDAGWRCAIAVDQDDRICVAYNKYATGSDGALKFAWKNLDDHTWQICTVDPDVQHDEDSHRSGTALALDAHGCPNIAYFDREIDGSSGVMFLKYARGTETVPLPGQVVVSHGPDPTPGPDAGATITVLWPDGFGFQQFDAYGTRAFGANTASGDVNSDGVPEIITGPGPGPSYAPLVRVFEPDGTAVPGATFPAYAAGSYGVNVACGDINGDGRNEIITGAGPGRVYGPHVRAFGYAEGPISTIPGVSFIAYATRQYGVIPAAGDIDGDGFDEIITGPGPGPMFGPHVRVWNHDGKGIAPLPGSSFLAYHTNRFGVVVASGDLNGDGKDEILTAPGPGPGFGSHIRGWSFDGTAVTPMYEINFTAFPGATAGASIACCDINDDGTDEFAVGPGPHPSMDAILVIYRLTEGRLAPLHEFSSLEGRFGIRVSMGAP